MAVPSFCEFFKEATGYPPFPYQERMATEGELPSLVHVPTGAGKTAAAVLGWLWRRRYADEGVRRATPRRLVYCLPMRVLVEQTRDNAILWLHRLELLGGKAELEGEAGKEEVKSYAPSWEDPNNVAVTVLMGGEDKDKWDIYPEKDAIIIGTQDMMLSRALNRGYALSRERWPMQFGLLHTDCLWILDEIQLMGTGLATTTQLEAFRHLLGGKDGHGCASVWMSATMQPDWLATVDFKDRVGALSPIGLDSDDHKNEEVQRRWRAKKELGGAQAVSGDAPALASEIHNNHKRGTRTIVVLNTVRRACELFESLSKPEGNGSSMGRRRKTEKSQPPEARATAANPKPTLVLLHSRFRPDDRENAVKQALADIDPKEPGTIVISTQVIEAGVDVSSTTLFTELAPWASLVQRFGRCNRVGKENGTAQVFWIDLPDAEHVNAAMPYELDQIAEARARLKKCENGVGPSNLPPTKLPYQHTHVIRRKDMIDLFDTTPDLAGNDIDVDRFVRDAEGSDVRVFWRDWPQPNGYEPPLETEPRPRREEICPAPVGELRDFEKKHRGSVWRWSFLDDRWEKADAQKIAPGQVFLIHVNAGGYAPERGWQMGGNARVEPVDAPEEEGAGKSDANEDDGPSRLHIWQTIAEHANDVCRELDDMLTALPFVRAEAAGLRVAARWHDRGKAHKVFQEAVDDGQLVERMGSTVQRRERPNGWQGCRVVAKAPGRLPKVGPLVDQGWWQRYDWSPNEGRRHFRHELASALAVLDPRQGQIPSESRDLIAYLVAAHHGKVRLSIRSLPKERHPEPRHDDRGEGRRFARGVWDGDELPSTDLGGGVTAPAVTLSLEPMELGLCAQEPFIGQPSWAERMIRLRETYGPFRLAYMEAVLRIADWRASATAEARADSSPREVIHV